MMAQRNGSRRRGAQLDLLLRWLLVVVCAAGLFVARSAAQTCNLTVTTLADSGAGSLREALATSADGGFGAAGPGVCFAVQGTITLASTLQITAPVAIVGGGAITLSGGNSFQVVLVSLSAPTDTASISGVTLTNGKGTGETSGAIGGGIYVEGGTVTLTGVTVTNNSATAGGGVYNQGTLTITGSSITNNTATDGLGGGITNLAGGTLTLQNTTVSGNVNNIADGGGIANGGALQIQGGSFSGNQAVDGGAITNQSTGQLTVAGGTVFSGNTGFGNAGALLNQGTAIVTAALFTGNQTQGYNGTSLGGAIYNESTLTVTESTFTGNISVGTGGAIESAALSLTLGNDTISGNTASQGDSGLQIDATQTDPTVINNTIISGNGTSDCSACTDVGTANLIGVTGRLLGPLASNGGPTQTMMPLPGSAAIAAGTETADTTDQRGFSRTANGSVDIGAVQTHYSSVAISTQPSTAVINQTITPPIAVQVVEVDGSTTNYPQGVPVTLTLLTPAGAATPAILSGTLTQYPTANPGGGAAALFNDLAVNTVGSYELLASTDGSTSTYQVISSYNAVSNAFQITPPAPTVTLSWQPAALVYGQPIPASELNAVATVNGEPGTGTFAYTFTATGATINVGQVYPAATYGVQVAFTPTGSTTPFTLGTQLQITQATPTLTWLAPAAIYTTMPLSAAQLNATAIGTNGASLPGSFVYTPAAGTMLTAGPHVLSTTFTPTDAVDYTTATARVTVQVNTATLTLVALSPNTSPFSTTPVPVTLTGTGFTATSVVEMNGVGLPTTVVSATTLSTSIPAASLGHAATLNLSVYDSTSNATSNTLPFTVTAPPANATVSIAATTLSDQQPAVNIALNAPYPAPLVGTLALTFAPSVTNGVDDPAVQFSAGGRSFTFTIPAGSTTTPQVALQTGTVAGTITVTLSLAANGVNVTPASLAPVTLTIAPAAPVITSVSFTNVNGLITVVVNGFSNTRDITETDFIFTGPGAVNLGSEWVRIPATDLFTPWYSSATSNAFGSAFSYTQTFQLGSPDPSITGVSVTLSNSIGTSASENSP